MPVSGLSDRLVSWAKANPGIPDRLEEMKPEHLTAASLCLGDVSVAELQAARKAALEAALDRTVDSMPDSDFEETRRTVAATSNRGLTGSASFARFTDQPTRPRISDDMLLKALEARKNESPAEVQAPSAEALTGAARRAFSPPGVEVMGSTDQLYLLQDERVIYQDRLTGRCYDLTPWANPAAATPVAELEPQNRAIDEGLLKRALEAFRAGKAVETTAPTEREVALATSCDFVPPGLEIMGVPDLLYLLPSDRLVVGEASGRWLDLSAAVPLDG